MNKSLLVIALISAFIITSCNSKKEEDKKDQNKPEENTETSKVHPSANHPNMLAEISISGMCQEINCIGAIKKLFSAMVGVTEIEIDYNTKTLTNRAKVKFNNSKINDKEIVSAIEKFNDGAYKVESVELKKIQEKPCPYKRKTENDDVSTASFRSSSSSSPGFALPSILDVFDVL